MSSPQPVRDYLNSMRMDIPPLTANLYLLVQTQHAAPQEVAPNIVMLTELEVGYDECCSVTGRGESAALAMY